MTRFRNYLMAALGFAIFVLPLMILNSRPADAQIGPPAARPVDVRVTNTATSPVPTVVLNTPSIEGSVSVVNTPTVAISSAANGVRVERTEDLPMSWPISSKSDTCTAKPCRRCGGHKREGGCALPGEVCWCALSYRHREVMRCSNRSQQKA